MPLVRSAHGSKGDRLVESDKSAAILDREAEEINVGQLFRAVDTVTIERHGIEQGDVVRPKGMIGGGDLLGDPFDCGSKRHRLWIAPLRHDPYKPVLRERARRPAARLMGSPPLFRRF